MLVILQESMRMVLLHVRYPRVKHFSEDNILLEDAQRFTTRWMNDEKCPPTWLSEPLMCGCRLDVSVYKGSLGLSATSGPSLKLHLSYAIFQSGSHLAFLISLHVTLWKLFDLQRKEEHGSVHFVAKKLKLVSACAIVVYEPFYVSRCRSFDILGYSSMSGKVCFVIPL